MLAASGLGSARSRDRHLLPSVLGAAWLARIKAMAEIHSTEDLLKALKEHPEWKSAVRDELLEEELAELPARVTRIDERLTRHLEQLTEKLDQIAERVADLD